MAQRWKTVHELVKTMWKMITPANGIQWELPPLIFGSFLPLRYQAIEEAGEDCSSDGDVYLETVKADETHVVRWL
ncbi:hypothetical protein K7X08_021518 [Anisodus acutangulus]|uniref:Uncharacterized protein n=1 Tax=Anisodus acutangulus TaxID=402998 RepID=A0A9Q1M7S8_9SOLA|nr:hypothetical protein K7X08_021518 [Anisodus acutangulus]